MSNPWQTLIDLEKSKPETERTRRIDWDEHDRAIAETEQDIEDEESEESEEDE